MALYFCLPLLVVLAMCLCNCSAQYERTPDNLDLTVDCGTNMITLEINVCTAQWAGFNTADLALNGNHNTTECQGSADTGVNPPVIRYELPVNSSHDNPCRQFLQVLDEAPDPTGPFVNFVRVQSVIITGHIDTPRSNQGFISYSTDLCYHFSCLYLLEDLLNNTLIAVSSVSVVTSDNSGTFTDTLKMGMFNDTKYHYLLLVPSTGLGLGARVFVEVKAVNLTGKHDVNLPGLVVGLVFGSAPAALMVLGGWFVLKRFYPAGGLPHNFD